MFMNVATCTWLNLKDTKTPLASSRILTNLCAGLKPLYQFRYFFTSLQDELFLPLWFSFNIGEILLFIQTWRYIEYKLYTWCLVELPQVFSIGFVEPKKNEILFLLCRGRTKKPRNWHGNYPKHQNICSEGNFVFLRSSFFGIFFRFRSNPKNAAKKKP